MPAEFVGEDGPEMPPLAKGGIIRPRPAVPYVPGKAITCKWCSKALGVLHGVFICPRCDYDHASATVIPNERDIKDQYPKP